MNGLGQTVEYLETGIRQFPEGSLRLVFIALLGFTFLWSGIAKARSPWNIALAMVDFRVARRPSLPIAWGVVLGELMLATVLLIGPMVSSAFTVVSTVIAGCAFVMFFVLIARALRADLSFACACFGSGDEQLTRKALARSGLLGVLAIACAAAGSFNTLAFGDLLLTWSVAAGVLGVVVLLARGQQLARLWRSSSVARA